MKNDGSRYLTTTDIRGLYPLGRTRLYEVLCDGSLPSVRWGRKYLVRESDLERFLSEEEGSLEYSQRAI